MEVSGAAAATGAGAGTAMGASGRGAGLISATEAVSATGEIAGTGAVATAAIGAGSSGALAFAVFVVVRTRGLAVFGAAALVDAFTVAVLAAGAFAGAALAAGVLAGVAFGFTGRRLAVLAEVPASSTVKGCSCSFINGIVLADRLEGRWRKFGKGGWGGQAAIPAGRALRLADLATVSGETVVVARGFDLSQPSCRGGRFRVFSRKAARKRAGGGIITGAVGCGDFLCLRA